MPKKVLLFCLLCFVSLLEAREVLVIAFDRSQDVLQVSIPSLQKELRTLRISSDNLAIKRFGDRFAIILPLDSLREKELLLVALKERYPHIFTIELPTARRNVSGTAAQMTTSTASNRWVWIVMIIFVFVLTLLFGRRFKELFDLRRLQRFMYRQQLEMAKELKEV